MNRVKRIVWVLVTVIVVGLFILILRPAQLPVSAVVAVRDYFVEFVEEEGRTIIRDPYIVSAPIDGYLQRVELDAGDLVQVDDRLFRIESSPAPALDARVQRQAREEVGAAEAGVARAETELETWEAEVGHAEREVERVERLVEGEALPDRELDDARRELDRARGNRNASEQAVEVARYELRNAEAVLEVAEGQRGEGEFLGVHSPVSGLVLRRHRWSEGTIPSGEAILEIGDLAQLEVQVDLLSMDAVRIAPDMRAILTRWGGERDLEARVRRVEPSGFMRVSALGVEEQRVPVLLVIEAPRQDWGPLGEGYRVEARFILWEGEDVLQIPAAALFRHEDAWAVFVVEEDRARLRHVQPGRRSGLWTQILSGLNAGEIVITHPGDDVADGARVDADVGEYR